MIQANELRIGNWVLKGSSELIHDSEGVKFVLNYDDKQPHQIELSDFSLLEKYPDLFDPITLTEERLQECGFNKSGGYIFEYKENPLLLFDTPTNWNNTENYPIGVEAVESNYFAGFISHGEIVIRSLFLHDLQNKFFAIENKEMEVNL